MNRVTKTELIVGNDTREDNVSYSYGSINRNNGIKLELLENLSVVTTTNKRRNRRKDLYWCIRKNS